MFVLSILINILKCQNKRLIFNFFKYFKVEKLHSMILILFSVVLFIEFLLIKFYIKYSRFQASRFKINNKLVPSIFLNNHWKDDRKFKILRKELKNFQFCYTISRNLKMQVQLRLISNNFSVFLYNILCK